MKVTIDSGLELCSNDDCQEEVGIDCTINGVDIALCSKQSCELFMPLYDITKTNRRTPTPDPETGLYGHAVDPIIGPFTLRDDEYKMKSRHCHAKECPQLPGLKSRTGKVWACLHVDCDSFEGDPEESESTHKHRFCTVLGCDRQSRESAIINSLEVLRCGYLKCEEYSGTAPTYTGDWEPPIELVVCSECGAVAKTYALMTGNIAVECSTRPCEGAGLTVRAKGESAKRAACLAWNELHG